MASGSARNSFPNNYHPFSPSQNPDGDVRASFVGPSPVDQTFYYPTSNLPFQASTAGDLPYHPPQSYPPQPNLHAGDVSFGLQLISPYSGSFVADQQHGDVSADPLNQNVGFAGGGASNEAISTVQRFPYSSTNQDSLDPEHLPAIPNISFRTPPPISTRISRGDYTPNPSQKFPGGDQSVNSRVNSETSQGPMQNGRGNKRRRQSNRSESLENPPSRGANPPPNGGRIQRRRRTKAPASSPLPEQRPRIIRNSQPHDEIQLETRLAKLARYFELSLILNDGFFYNVHHLRGLGLMTGLSEEAVERWVMERISQGKTEIDSGYSTTTLQLPSGDALANLKSLAASGALSDRTGCPEKSSQRGKYKCSWCPASFATKREWARHEGYRFPQKGWLCPFCYEGYHLKHNFTNHLKKHPGVVPNADTFRFQVKRPSTFRYDSVYCTKRFLHWSDRINHVFDCHLEQNGKCDNPNLQNPDASGQSDEESSASSDDTSGDYSDGHGHFDDLVDREDLGSRQDEHQDGREGRSGRSERRSESGSTTNHQMYQAQSYRLRPPPALVFDALQQSPGGRPGEERCVAPAGTESDCQPTSVPGSDPHISKLPLDGNSERTSLFSSLKAGLVPSSYGQHLTFKPSDPLPFTLIKSLGRGGFGTVDLVYGKDARRNFARKTIHFLSHSAYSRILKEVQIMNRLRHPHIISFVGTYSQGREFAIIMSPAADGDLGSYMEDFSFDNHVGKRLLCRWYSCLVSGLRYMHDSHILHKDIKPTNIVVKGEDILLCDFGLSISISPGESTSSDWGLMTRVYASPEMARGEIQTRSVDIFSLGCVFLEISTVLANKRLEEFRQFRSARSEHSNSDPSYHGNLLAVMQWIAELRQRQLLSPVPRALDSSIHMLSEDPRDRPNVRQLADVFPPNPCCNARIGNSDPNQPLNRLIPINFPKAQPASHCLARVSEAKNSDPWTQYSEPVTERFDDLMGLLTKLIYIVENETLRTPNQITRRWAQGYQRGHKLPWRRDGPHQPARPGGDCFTMEFEINSLGEHFY
ncbi:MAG: hypothetical protein M1840_006566 [Geoglossum simile]|nr:MAG: hypothetical protein M1840_006566 [Geoglossum simile]